jgi:predicted nucleic acid-binding protein
MVIDASALIEYLLDASRFPRLRELLATRRIHAPHLLDLELTQALRLATIRNLIRPDRAASALDDLAALSIERHTHIEYLKRIWSLRHNITAYDACYVALAESLNVPLLTRDRRLAQSSGHAARIEYID